MKVLIADDLLATGGTAAACVSLVESLGGEVHSLHVLHRARVSKRAQAPRSTPRALSDNIRLTRVAERDSWPP